MAVNIKQKEQHRRWLQFLVVALVIVAAVIIFLSKDRIASIASTTTKSSKGEIEKMMGIKGTPPEKLKSFQSVDGVVDIQHWVTDHGVPVYFVRIPTIPMVDVELVFDAGAARNGGKGGLAYLTNELLADGTLELTANQVAENFDNLGAQYHAESQRDQAIIHLRTLSDPAQVVPAVQTLSAILSKPRFPEDGFKREQQKALSALAQQAQLPQYVASRALFSALYENQPYANWVLGDEASIKALTVDDIKAFHKKYYVAKNVVVTIVGDVTPQDADTIAQALTNNLPEGEKAPLIPEVASLGKKSAINIDFPSAQTHILIGQPGVKQGDPDYYALMVGNHILGGNGSVTRIFNTIRNQHGLAYSASSYFLPMRERGPFVLTCQTRNDKAEQSQTMMRELLKEFVANGPTEKELEQAKLNLLGGYALHFDSNANICREVGTLGFYGLGLNHFNEYKPAIEKLNVNDIKNAFQKRIAADNLIEVSVGGKAQNGQPSGPLKGIQNPPPREHHGMPGGSQG